MKRGFTLIELLAVIVILSVILSIAIASINNVISEAKYSSYIQTKSNVVSATKVYVVSHTDKIPQNIGDRTFINLQELKDDKLIDDVIIDSRTGEEIMNGSVAIDKTGLSEYKYTFMPSNIVKDGLILWLDGKDFRNATKPTLWEDASGNGYNGNVYNFSYDKTSGSNDNGGVVFDGSNDYLNVGSIPSLTDNVNITLEATVSFDYLDYTNNTGKLISIFKKGNTDAIEPHTGFTLTYDNRNNRKSFDFTCFGNVAGGYSGGNNDFTEISYSFTPDTVYTITVVINNSVGYFYINGIQQGNAKTFTGLQLVTPSSMDIGKWAGVSNSPITISSARIYNRALTSSEVLQNYNSEQ